MNVCLPFPYLGICVPVSCPTFCSARPLSLDLVLKLRNMSFCKEALRNYHLAYITIIVISWQALFVDWQTFVILNRGGYVFVCADFSDAFYNFMKRTADENSL